MSGQYVIASNFVPNRAFVFHATSGTLVATIQNPTSDDFDGFGTNIVTNGKRVAISAPGDDTDGTDQGMVYVFDLPFGQTVGTLSTTDPDAGDTFTYV